MGLSRILASAAAMGASGLLTAAGCSNGAATLATDPDASPFPPLGNVGGVGTACDQAHVCRPGLACNAGTCQPGRSLDDGRACMISAECKYGLYCGPKRTCAAAGQGENGTSCGSDAECRSGLRCNLVGFAAECKPEGTVDLGGKCEASGDCFGGLACAAGACAPLPATDGLPPLGIPSWAGVDCPVDDPLPIKVYFRVPRGSQDGDFFRLPFPNDVRLSDGHPNLSGFPTPGKALLGFDVVDRYARYVEQKTDGFSASPTVTFRFSGDVNFDSLKADGVLRFVDLTTGDDLGFGWSATTGPSPYVCFNSMSVRPPTSAPLTPGHTVAVLVNSGGKAASGAPLARDADLGALLGAAAPSEGPLAAAYGAYRPLRDWLTARTIDPGTIVGASVFTVGHVTDTPAKLATAIAALPVPTAAGWVKCQDGATSPCAQAAPDACKGGDPAFEELQALVTLPIFQKGNAPYVTPEDGGDFDFVADGTPKVVRSEPVCLSLTVPKGAAMPAGGYPLVVHAHGTGGNFRSHITDGLAGRLASVDDGAGGTIRMAMLGIDQVSHGTRRGSSTQTPDRLFYNFANPAAALGNPLQGAADVISLSRFAKQLVLAADPALTNTEIRFGSVAFWGHSQGSTEGGIALPYTADVTGAVFSGQGAGLIDALLNKKKPYDVSAAIPVVLQDPHVSADHPVLSVLQQAIDPADPLNHAAAIARKPLVAGGAKHVFQPFGQTDTYAPDVTETTFALSAGLGLVTPASSVTKPTEIGKLVPMALPAGGNAADGARAISVLVRQYAPAGYDGHFVAFRDPTAQLDTAHFLADLAAGKTPTLR